MDPFDPVINYGPNDAGVSAISITIILLGLLAAAWGIGSLYAFISDFFNRTKKKNDENN